MNKTACYAGRPGINRQQAGQKAFCTKSGQGIGTRNDVHDVSRYHYTAMEELFFDGFFSCFSPMCGQFFDFPIIISEQGAI